MLFQLPITIDSGMHARSNRSLREVVERLVPIESKLHVVGRVPVPWSTVGDGMARSNKK